MTESETEKPWEKPWDPQELINSSNNWSLAGDAGLLLYLKKFSDNFMTKAANIEKDLQKLTFEEQQCHVKFENVITNFLQLENTQFIENRVYEQDVTTLGTSIENEKIEKTKEEKEQDLFEVITESVQIGMSIMDTYFDKIDGSKLDESEDEDDQYRNEDLVIYETKDPYVLRSLPYLIGSEAYLENDHVGLKDLEDEIDEEEEEEEEEENEEQVETESELETESEQETNDSESESEKDELFSNAVKNDDLFDDGSEEEQTDLFSVKKKPDNLFDDDDDDDDESEAESKSIASSTHSDSQSKQTNAEVTEKPLDFASELRRKLAMKPSQNTQNESSVNQKNNVIKEPVQQKQKIIEQKHSDLFGNSESDSDSESLFSKPSTNKQTLFDDLPSNQTQQVKADLKEKNTIFDDEYEEDDNDLFSKPSVTQTKKSSEISKVPPNELDSSAKINKTNASLFESDDDDDEDDFFSDKKVEIKPIKPAVQSNENLDETIKKHQSKNEVEKKPDSPKSDLLENQEDHSKTKSEQNKISIFPSPKVNSLFDDDSDDDDLFSKPVDKSKLSENKISLDKKENNEIKSINKIPVPKTTPKSLFDDENEDDDDDLFSKPKNEPKMSEVKPIDINEQTNKSKIKNQTMDDKLEASKTVGGLFNDEDEDDDDDLFSMSKNEPKLMTEKPITKNEKLDPILNKVVQAPKTTGGLFDDDNEEDDLFSKRENKTKLNEKKNSQNIKETIEIDKNEQTSNKVIQAPKTTGSLFDDDDDDNEDDDLFSKTSGEKSQPNEGKVKIDERNMLKSETELIKPKPVVKNVLFDPLALKSSGLFKKLAQNNDSEDDAEIEDKKNSKNEQINRPEIEAEKSKNFFSTSPIKTNSSNLSSNQESTDSFNDILASTAPIISTVQKDRIKAVSAKKRPPTKQRKQTLEIENVPEVSEKVLSSDNQFKERIEVGHNNPKQVNLESEPASKSENVKDVLKTEDNLTKTKVAQSSLFDNLDEDDDDIFKVDLEKKKSKSEKKIEPKSKETKVVNNSLFDNLDDDIFNIDSKVIDEKKSIKKNDNLNSASNSTVKQEAKKNIFDDLDDFEDIFASVPKKKPEKKKPTFEDSIFD